VGVEKAAGQIRAEYILPSTRATVMTGMNRSVMQKVFVANDLIEANFVKDLLVRGGVAAEVQGEQLFGLRPHIGFADPTLYPSVWIIEGQLKLARALIEDYERRKRISASEW